MVMRVTEKAQMPLLLFLFLDTAIWRLGCNTTNMHVEVAYEIQLKTKKSQFKYSPYNTGKLSQVAQSCITASQKERDVAPETFTQTTHRQKFKSNQEKNVFHSIAKL